MKNRFNSEELLKKLGDIYSKLINHEITQKEAEEMSQPIIQIMRKETKKLKEMK